MTQSEIQDIDRYLEEMGVQDDSLRHKLQNALPWADSEEIKQAAASRGKLHPSIIRLNRLQPSNNALTPLFVIHNASGSLSGARGVFSEMERACFGLILPSEAPLWGVTDVVDLAHLFVAVIKSKRPVGPYALAGVGFGCIIAYEIAVQMQEQGDKLDVLLLFEDSILREGWMMVQQPWFKAYGLIESQNHSADMKDFVAQGEMLAYEGYDRQIEYILSLMPNTMNDAEWDSLVQDRVKNGSLHGYGWEEALITWSAIYSMISGKPGFNQTLSEFLLKLTTIESIDHQLDYLASLNPNKEMQKEWEVNVNEIISMVSFLKYITSNYKPKRLFHGESIFLHADKTKCLKDFIGGWAAGTLRSISTLVLPATLQVLPDVKKVDAVSIAREVELGIHAGLRRWVATQNAMRENLVNDRGFYAADAHPEGGGTNQFVQVTALNDLCSSHSRSYISASTILNPGEKTEDKEGPITCLPVWVVHDEKGDTGGTVRQMARNVRAPCYGLNMGPQATLLTSIDDLGEHYSEIILKMQRQGPYLVLGMSIIGSMIAFAAACRLERLGHKPMLILVDGPAIFPDIALHEPTWYSLFFTLREMGTMKLGIGDFIDHVSTATSPADQLRLVRTYKPGNHISDEKWDSVVYTALNRSTLMKKIMSKFKPAYRFTGPVVTVLPEDRLGAAFLDATREACDGPISYMPTDFRHTECTTSKRNRRSTNSILQVAILEVLEML